MARNCRFAVAVHVCTLLAMQTGKPVTSDWIAGSVNTNPVVVRRILSALAKAGLVESIRGSSGGSVLSRPADKVSLLQIHRAVDEEEGPQLHHQPPNQDCPVGRGIQPVLVRIIDRADAARDAVLGTTMLSEVVSSVSVECR